MMNVNGLLACALIGAWPPTAAAGQAIRGRDADQATVWYLRHAGWAVRLGDALLIFDYQESLGMEDVTVETPRNLANGFIDPREIADLDVFVFVTHAHGDHYDPVIFRWQGQIAHPTYVIGWEEEPASHCKRFVRDQTACHTMRGPRATAELDDLRVYTINSHHDDVPDVAYLVRYGDWTVYHNGDYMADYLDDHGYLKTLTDHIDLAFVAGLADRRWPHLARAVHLARAFDVPVLFPMHFRDQAMCDRFAAEVATEAVAARVACPTARGQRFVVTRSEGGR